MKFTELVIRFKNRIMPKVVKKHELDYTPHQFERHAAWCNYVREINEADIYRRRKETFVKPPMGLYSWKTKEFVPWDQRPREHQ